MGRATRPLLGQDLVGVRATHVLSSAMEWAKPEFSKSQVNRAARVLLDPNASEPDFERALTVVNNWRSSHYYPLNTFNDLRRRATSPLLTMSPDKAPKLKLSVAILKNRRSILIKIRLRRDYEKGDVALAAARARDGPMPRPWFCHA